MSYLHKGGFPKEKKKPHECLAWISNELIPLSAFQVNISSRMRSSIKYALPGKVQNKGTKAIDLFPFFQSSLQLLPPSFM